MPEFERPVALKAFQRSNSGIEVGDVEGCDTQKNLGVCSYGSHISRTALLAIFPIFSKSIVRCYACAALTTHRFLI